VHHLSMYGERDDTLSPVERLLPTAKHIR